MYEESELMHHGILKQRWGHQNGPPYPLSEEQKSAAEIRAEKKDLKWAKRNEKRITKGVYKKSEKELRKYLKNELNVEFKDQVKSGRIGLSYVNKYNRKLAELMNKNVGSIPAPSGRVVQFVAKRGEVGVYMALADIGYDISKLKQGVYASGRQAYKKSNVNMASY